jgi:hypothetical protein
VHTRKKLDVKHFYVLSFFCKKAGKKSGKMLFVIFFREIKSLAAGGGLGISTMEMLFTTPEF